METKADTLSDKYLNFGVIIIRLCEKLQHGMIQREIAKQLFRAGTSIGANYEEANSISRILAKSLITAANRKKKSITNFS